MEVQYLYWNIFIEGIIYIEKSAQNRWRKYQRIFSFQYSRYCLLADLTKKYSLNNCNWKVCPPTKRRHDDVEISYGPRTNYFPFSGKDSFVSFGFFQGPVIVIIPLHLLRTKEEKTKWLISIKWEKEKFRFFYFNWVKILIHQCKVIARQMWIKKGAISKSSS